MISIDLIFQSVGLVSCGPVAWGTRIGERLPGVYVIAVDLSKAIITDRSEMLRLGLCDGFNWGVGENIVYIGRTQQPLHRRLNQFYRHECGNRSPHRGGQVVLTLKVVRQVYWAVTPRPVECERGMIEGYLELAGRLPFANKVRGWQRKTSAVAHA